MKQNLVPRKKLLRKKLLTLNEFGSFFFGKLGLSTWSIIYLAFGIIIIFVESYLFGHPILESSALPGNDSSIHLLYIKWFDRFWPNVPMWLPLQGTGESLVQQYPIATYLLTVFLHRQTSLSLVELMKIIYFLSVPLTAIGVYIFAWYKTKNQTIGLLAGVFYPLSAASWSWIFYGGFYAQQFSLIFVMPTMVFFDLYLVKVLENSIKQNRIRAIWFLLFVLFYTTTILFHTATGIITTAILFVYGLIISQEKARGMRWLRFKRFLRAYLSAVLVGLGLSAFFTYLFFRYTAIGNRDGLIYWDVNQIPYLKLDNFFGFRKFDNSSYATVMEPLWDTLFFSIPVGILAAVGAFWALVRRNWSMIALAILSVLIIGFAVAPHEFPSLVKPFSKLWSAVYLRTLLGLMLFLPILAAFGARETFNTIISSPFYLYRYIQTRSGLQLSISKHWLSAAGFSLAKSVKNLAVFVLTITSVYFLLNHYLGVTNKKQWGEFYTGYGPIVQNDYHLFKLVESKSGDWETDKSPRRNWPRYQINSEHLEQFHKGYNKLVKKLNLSDQVRVDFASGFGGPIMRFNLYTDTSQIEAYSYNLVINHALWGYQQSQMYSKFANEKSISNLAYWYGLEYVFPSDEMIEKIKDSPNWKEIDNKDINIEGINLPIWQYRANPGLVNIINMPKILVIGQFKNKAFYDVFKLSSEGMLNYNEAILIEGKESGRIDDYSVEELKEFDGIILHAWQYKNRKRAYNLIDKYIKEGGRVMISTGWQYGNRDWEAKKTADFLPVEDLEWTNFGTNSSYKIQDEEVAGNINTDKFGKLDYFGTPWGVSVTKKEKLRDWARVILTVRGEPLVAGGEYGQGKVVWTGLNWFAHIKSYQDAKDEESKFLRNMMQWLVSDKIKKPESQRTSHDPGVNITRDYPDRVEFTLTGDFDQESSLLWRESYYPDWKAKFINKNGQTENLNIYRAGPGMMLVNLPTQAAKGDQVILEYYRNNTGLIISLITFYLLVFYLVDVLISRGLVTVFLYQNLLVWPYQKISQIIAHRWEKDEE